MTFFEWFGARRSGRTTAMLTEAIRLATEGQYVFVVASHLDARSMLLRHAVEIAHRQGLSTEIVEAGSTVKLYVANKGQISFESASSQQLDWQQLRMRGAHPSTRVLIDHHALEDQLLREYGAAIEQALDWTRRARNLQPKGRPTITEQRDMGIGPRVEIESP